MSISITDVRPATLYALVEKVGMRNTRVIVKGGFFEDRFARRKSEPDFVILPP